jgi:hypothetical protein
LDFLKFRNAEHFLSSAGLSVEEGLKIVENVLEELKKKKERTKKP